MMDSLTLDFGMLDYSDNDEPVHPKIQVDIDDIVQIAVRDMQPVFYTSTKYDELVQLRILGQHHDGECRRYVVLVTGCDSSKIKSSVVVNTKLQKEFGIENRFFGEEAVVMSELHIRKVISKQDGRFCSRCKEYNTHAKISKHIEYTCMHCKENPYR